MALIHTNEWIERNKRFIPTMEKTALLLAVKADIKESRPTVRCVTVVGNSGHGKGVDMSADNLNNAIGMANGLRQQLDMLHGLAGDICGALLKLRSSAPSASDNISVMPCPHFFNGTDGVHCVLIDRCNHPDREQWRASASDNNTRGEIAPRSCLNCESRAVSGQCFSCKDFSNYAPRNRK
jgi:hypothetical protein